MSWRVVGKVRFKMCALDSIIFYNAKIMSVLLTVYNIDDNLKGRYTTLILTI